MKMQMTTQIKFLVVAVLIFAGAVSQATEHRLDCQPTQRPDGIEKWAVLGLNLDDQYYDPGSGLALITDARWTFMYSSARLICDNDHLDIAGGKKKELSCIGYVHGGRIEVKGELENGAGKMLVHNIDANNVYAGMNEGLELNCALDKN